MRQQRGFEIENGRYCDVAGLADVVDGWAFYGNHERPSVAACSSYGYHSLIQTPAPRALHRALFPQLGADGRRL